MEKSKIQGGNLKLLAVAAFLIITPLLSTSLRFKYLYFIVNILVVALGAEAGLLSFLLQPQPRPPPADDDVVDDNEKPVKDVAEESDSIDDHAQDGGDDDDEMMEDDDAEDHELYHKAEMFIGNFYKQLKMQGQESWNIIHD